jgi:peptidoglycan hydrolase-like protein with peptidoglycan-binding domain
MARKTVTKSRSTKSTSPRTSNRDLLGKLRGRFLNKPTAIIFVLLFVAVGIYVISNSHASSFSGELSSGLSGSLCMQDNGDTIDTANCFSQDGSQNFTIVPVTSSIFEIQNYDGTCVDDWNGSIVTGPANRQPLRVYKCYANDIDQEWHWVGPGIHQLENIASGGCINIAANNTTPGAEVIAYSCSGNPPNERWYEKVTSGGGGGGSTNPAATQCPSLVASGLTFSTSTPSGSYTNCIKDVQAMVNGVHAYALITTLEPWPTSGICAPYMSADGVYGSTTKANVVCAQNALAISTDGVVGPQTLYALCETAKNKVSGSSSADNNASTAGYNAAVDMFGKLTNGQVNCRT